MTDGTPPVPVRVAVVDDHEPVRAALEAACTADGLEFTAGGASVAETVARLGGRPVDVVVLDLSLGDGVPVGDNVAALRRLGAPVLVHSIADRVSAVQEALAAGAAGVVPKGGATAVVLAAARAVAAGRVLNNLEWATALDADAAFVRGRLEPLERPGLAAVASGLPVSAVAERTGVSVAAVREALSRVRDRYCESQAPLGG